MIRYLSHPDQFDDVSPLIAVGLPDSEVYWSSADSLKEALQHGFRLSCQHPEATVTVFSPGPELPCVEAEFVAGDRRIPISHH